MGHRIDLLAQAVLFFGLAILLFYIGFGYTEMPEIHKRWPDGECVRMIVRADALPCPANLPEKYTTLWVR